MLLLTFLTLLSMTGSLPDDPFQDLSFQAALEKAQSSKKLVFVDFYTTWCAPCKKLDKVTWTDEEVRRWLAEHTVPLKVDAEKESELAARYRIQSYPSLAFIRPDGSLQDVVVGFKEPKEFLAVAGDILAGKSVVDLARQRVAENETDFGARLELGRELVNRGQYEEALKHYLWCWDHGLEHNSGYGGVRLSFLLGDVARLGARYPAARQALRDRRDACRRILLDGKGAFHEAMDLAALNRELGEAADTLRVYDSLPELQADERTLASMRMVMFPQVIDLLLEERRYRDVLDGAGDVDQAIEKRLRLHQLSLDQLEDRGAAEMDPALAGMLKGQVTAEGAKYYEALLGLNRLDEAGRVSARLLAFDSSYSAFKTLVERAQRAGAAETVEQLLAAAQQGLSEAEHRRLQRSVERARER